MEKSLSIFLDDDTATAEPETKMTNFELYHSSNLDILVTQEPLEVCSNEHAHEGYEFFIPLLFSPHLKALTIEDTVVHPKPGNLFPCNPGQLHGADGYFTIYDSVCIYIQKNYLQETAYRSSGIREVIFCNEANPYNHNLKQLVNHFVREARSQQAGYKFILESLSTQIVIDLLRNTKNNIKDKMNRKETGTRENILQVIEYLTENYNQKLTNAELLDIVNLSPYYFIRLFKKETGKTPHEYLVNLKIDKARELLVFSDYSITEICFLCGFSEHSHFSKVFKKFTGTTPLSYRKTYKSPCR